MEVKPLKDRRRLLKVKLCSLMAEAKIIRREESRTRHPQLKAELWFHRVKGLRGEARRTHVAYGYVKGYPYSRVEQKRVSELTEADWKAVAAMIKKYGPPGRTDETPILDAWKKT